MSFLTGFPIIELVSTLPDPWPNEVGMAPTGRRSRKDRRKGRRKGRRPKNRIIRVVIFDGRVFKLHATKGWRSHRLSRLGRIG
jgi:hypothetical protein